MGSQKQYFWTKYLKKKPKNNSFQSTISVLDSDGEDNPKMVKKLIKIANEKRIFLYLHLECKGQREYFLKFLIS